MNKVFDLYNFLKASGFNKEFGILKTALETTPEELEAAFPQLFRFYEEGKPTAMFGGIFAQINKYIEQGYITEQEVNDIQTFESLKQKMKELKSIKKETEAKFKYLNEYDIEQEFKDLAKEKKLSKEDFEFAYKSFIAEDEDNHQLEQAIVEIADLREKYRLLKEKVNTIEDNEELLSRLADPLAYKTLDNANTEINNLMMDVHNIIEGRQAGGLKSKLLNYYDYIYNGENKLNADYPKERAGKAKETSKVLYNDGSWAIVNSWSEEACQYWERSAVRVEGDKVIFNTCTSRIKGVHGLTNQNLYEDYSGYAMFQILKLENGQPKFYESPNEMLTLCFDFKDNNFEMIQGSSASVNANNNNMTKEMVAEALPENIYSELQNILNSDKKYELLNFEQLLDSDVPDEIRSELMLSSVKKLKSSRFFKLKNKIPENLFNSLSEEKAKKLSSDYFFPLKQKIPEAIFNSLVEEKAKGISSLNFFKKVHATLPEGIFDSLAKQKAKEFDPYYFFVFKDLIPEQLFNSLAEQKAKELNPRMFFEHKNLIIRASSRDIYDSLAEEKSKEIGPNDFFDFVSRIARVISEDLYRSLVEKNAEKLSPNDFFKHMEKIESDVFSSLAKEKVKGVNPEDFIYLYYENMKYDNMDQENIIIKEFIQSIDPYKFFEYRNQLPKNLYLEYLEEKAKNLGSNFFDHKDHIPEDVLKKLISKYSKVLEPKDFFSYREYIPENLFDAFVEQKAKDLQAEYFFYDYYRIGIPEDIFTSLIETKLKELYHYISEYRGEENLEWYVRGDELLLLNEDGEKMFSVDNLPQSILRGDLQKYSRYKDLSNLFIKYSK